MEKDFSDYMDNEMPVPKLPIIWKILFTIAWVIVILIVVCLVISVIVGFIWLILPK
jgi:hypothetical protein